MHIHRLNFMNTEIIVEERIQYGQRRLYIISEHAVAVRSLTNTETITYGHVAALKALGFTVKVAAVAARAL
jgi:hypothetical protein